MRKRGDLWKNLKGRFHLHLCTICQRVYNDACYEPQTNEQCRYCTGLDRPVWLLDRDPRYCCEDRQQVTSLTTRGSYRLAGDQTWAICPTCKRVSIYRRK